MPIAFRHRYDCTLFAPPVKGLHREIDPSGSSSATGICSCDYQLAEKACIVEAA